MKNLTDRGARLVAPVLLEVALGVHPFTGRRGFFAYARKTLGNFPVCWRLTEREAKACGEIMMNKEKP